LGGLGLGLRAVSPGAGKITGTVFTDPEILPAFRTAEGSAKRFRIFYRRSAIPAHGLIIQQESPLLNIENPCYTDGMFTMIPCAAGCGRPALTGSSLCALHSISAEAEAGRIAELITGKKTVKDLSAQGLHFEGIDFSGRAFYGCNFSASTFSGCRFSGASMGMVFFDFSTFLSCDFSKADFQFMSFAGSSIQGCGFEGSELVHINFGGTRINDSSFNGSNLYNSRFVNAEIIRTSVKNCNLKRVNFINARQEAVSFKSSNTAEAIFEMGETG
jgi:uncharacterized protein YjbI with pentapeptide repeats